ncbi:hypothetical protein HAX54_040485 [Datura stramonium]|uniref:Uncharacterized protein n=1 Tax=Datura stramonium TaxID=4076 RepID=A0ABS8VR57_DATST|nr:hypothetical protein [Datura stramonium]
MPIPQRVYGWLEIFQARGHVASITNNRSKYCGNVRFSALNLDAGGDSDHQELASVVNNNWRARDDQKTGAVISTDIYQPRCSEVVIPSVAELYVLAWKW